jgi:hypothetical protein
MTTTPPRPLSGPPPAEVPLPRAPLARVIAQVRFAPILTIRNPDSVAVFQEAVRATYPILSEDRIHQIVMASAGTPDIREGVIWRFTEGEKRQWRASLSVDFIALETSAYVSRQDFLERLGAILVALVGNVRRACVAPSFRPRPHRLTVPARNRSCAGQCKQQGTTYRSDHRYEA